MRGSGKKSLNYSMREMRKILKRYVERADTVLDYKTQPVVLVAL